MTHKIYEIREAIRNVEQITGKGSFATRLLDGNPDLEGNPKEVFVEGLGLAVNLEDTGRIHESTIWIVFSLDGQLYRISGYYDSYDGIDWGDLRIKEVVVEEKTVIVYNDI